MQIDILAGLNVNDLTRTRSTGQPINSHVVPARQPAGPDYERMQRIVHNVPAKPAAEAPEPATR
jgi:hypothetical protein